MSTSSMAPLHILLAEDDDNDFALLQHSFSMAAAASTLHWVCNGIEALAYLTGERAYANRSAYPFPHMLLLDLNMPGMHGFEVIEWVRQNPRCSRLIIHVLSVSARDADLQRAYDLGANSYIIKPSSMTDLTDFVRALHYWHQFIALPSCEAHAKPRLIPQFGLPPFESSQLAQTLTSP